MTETPLWLNQIQSSWYHEWATVEQRKHELEELGLPTIEQLACAPLKTDYGDFTELVYGDRTTGDKHRVLVYGDINNGAIGNGEDLLVRAHSACWTSEVTNAVNCECREEKDEALRDIADEGRGIFVYLQQEGRGTGDVGKGYQLNEMLYFNEDGEIHQRRDENGNRIDTDTAYRNVGFPSECRDFEVAGKILFTLGVKSIRLLTNNPDKIKGIEQSDIKVKPVEIHIKPTNKIVAADLKSKHDNLGHNINPSDWNIGDQGGGLRDVPKRL